MHGYVSCHIPPPPPPPPPRPSSYHSFYALHQHGAYDYLLDEYDRQHLPWLRRFQEFDLYSKSDEAMDVPALTARYQALAAKYLPPVLRW
jgi:inositol oxygenase